MRNFIIIACLCFGLALGCGCSKKTVDANPVPWSQKTITMGELQALTSTVLFDFDKYDIKPMYQSMLKQKAEILKKNGGILKITIEGACDVKGSPVYNATLGLKRAVAVRDFMVAEGVDAKMLQYISLGKMIQLPKMAGESDEDWRLRNRRSEFHVGVVNPTE